MHFHRRRPRLLSSVPPLLAAALLCAAAAGASAQSTGNPKGTTVPPAQGTAEKAPASRSPNAGTARPNTEDTRNVTPGERAGHLRTPGSGTTGGLSGRHPQGDSGKAGQTSTPESIPQRRGNPSEQKKQ